MKNIFSTYVEVFLNAPILTKTFFNFLHVCGGVSAFQPIFPDNQTFSPRMWRCFFGRLKVVLPSPIFSTYVEVFPRPHPVNTLLINFLHVCGGVSEWFRDENLQDSFSPRMWRCFRSSNCDRVDYGIFSTYVEVFLHLFDRPVCVTHFLHVCGGVSTYQALHHGWREFSPRMWRCFRRLIACFNLRRNFLHVCGGVSQYFLLFNQKNIIYKVFSY